MSKTGRGCLVLLGIVVFMGACIAFTFGALPGAGVGVALPVIVVPGEPYLENWPSAGFYWTNTLSSTVLVDILIVLLFIVIARRVSKGWLKEVPGRFQGFVELVGEFIYGQAKNFAGASALTRNWLFPLAASIFVFVLFGNLVKLVPGYESVGVMHCAGHASAETGITVSAGFPSLGSNLYVSRPLQSAYAADEDDYHACEAYKEGHVEKPSQEALTAAAGHLRDEEETIRLLRLAPEAQDAQIEEARLHAAEEVWEHASIGLTPEALEQGVVPYLQVVTPYLRGMTTDLNVPLALALIVVVAVQVFGVAALGPNYFQKFVNLRALGNLGKNPMGGIDFVVGLLEIISEIGKIISLTFRLFGNLFAGGILLAVMSFLVAMFLPVVFMGLELVVGTIQAYVFAVLTLVFAGQAMVSHHHDDDDHHDTQEHHA